METTAVVVSAHRDMLSTSDLNHCLQNSMVLIIRAFATKCMAASKGCHAQPSKWFRDPLRQRFSAKILQEDCRKVPCSRRSAITYTRVFKAIGDCVSFRIVRLKTSGSLNEIFLTCIAHCQDLKALCVCERQNAGI